MQQYKWFQLFDDLPAGWKMDNTAGSPLFGYSFCCDGKSILRGGKRALVRVVPAQIPLQIEVECSEVETTIAKSENKKPSQIIDATCAKTVNELARQKFKQRILNDIMVDLMICEIEGWCKMEYIRELKELICSIGNGKTIDA